MRRCGTDDADARRPLSRPPRKLIWVRARRRGCPARRDPPPGWPAASGPCAQQQAGGRRAAAARPQEGGAAAQDSARAGIFRRGVMARGRGGSLAALERGAVTISSRTRCNTRSLGERPRRRGRRDGRAHHRPALRRPPAARWGRGCAGTCSWTAAPAPACRGCSMGSCDDQAPRALLLTHVHLDHAGAARRWWRAGRSCRCTSTPAGRPHLADPTRLVASARRGVRRAPGGAARGGAAGTRGRTCARSTTASDRRAALRLDPGTRLPPRRLPRARQRRGLLRGPRGRAPGGRCGDAPDAPAGGGPRRLEGLAPEARAVAAPGARARPLRARREHPGSTSPPCARRSPGTSAGRRPARRRSWPRWSPTCASALPGAGRGGLHVRGARRTQRGGAAALAGARAGGPVERRRREPLASVGTRATTPALPPEARRASAVVDLVRVCGGARGALSLLDRRGTGRKRRRGSKHATYEGVGPLPALCARRRGIGATGALGGLSGRHRLGRNSSGQLGDGTLENSRAPIPVSGLGEVLSVAAGSEHSLALLSERDRDGVGRQHGGPARRRQQHLQRRARPGERPQRRHGDRGRRRIQPRPAQQRPRDGLGQNLEGKLGDGLNNSSNVPVEVSGLSEVTAISAGGKHALALQSDQRVKAWGSNKDGQLGIGVIEQRRETPVEVKELGGVTAIAAGGLHSLALLSNGTVEAWGAQRQRPARQRHQNQQRHGRRGPGPDRRARDRGGRNPQPGGAHRRRSVRLGRRQERRARQRHWDCRAACRCRSSGLTEVSSVGAGKNFSVALQASGNVWTWGVNGEGQLGTGSKEPHSLQPG